MADTPTPAEPATRCGACDQEDDHPKHSILVGIGSQAVKTAGGEIFHPHDHDRDGVVHYHFDCPSPWHDLHSALGQHDDPAAHAARMAVADHHARVVALARSGVNGAELRRRIVAGEV